MNGNLNSILKIVSMAGALLLLAAGLIYQFATTQGQISAIINEQAKIHQRQADIESNQRQNREFIIEIRRDVSWIRDTLERK